MAATAWLIRAFLRRRVLALVPLALVVAAGATGTLVAIGAAQRTDTAYDRYLDRAVVGDLLINPSLSTTEIDAVIRSLPGVRSVSTHILLNVAAGDSADARFDEVDNGDPTQVLGSVDGRYLTTDRPALQAGRLPTGEREAIVDLELAKEYEVQLGDVVPLSFWSSADLLAVEDGRATSEPSPVGFEEVTIVGIAALSDEVLPDGLYPRQRMVVSPDVAARYDCAPQALPVGGTYEEIVAAVFPGRCAISYRYYSLEIEGGDRGVAAAQDAFVRRGAELNAQLPAVLTDAGVGYTLIPTTTERDRTRVDRATSPTVVALTVLGIAAGVVTLVVAVTVVARSLRRTVAEQRHWWRLGLTTGERTTVVTVPMLLAVVAGLAVSVVAAWWLSPFGPVGNVRTLEPSPSRQLSPWVWWAVAALAVVLAAAVVALAFTMSRRVGRPRAPRREVPVVGRFVRSSSRPEVGEGVRAAFDGDRGAGFVVAAGAIATAVVLTPIIFAASLSALLTTSSSYGWPWDAAVVAGYGYGGLDLGAVQATLDERDDVERWSVLAFTNSVAVGGEPVPSVIGLGGSSDVTLAEGRLPRAADEVALGSKTAATHGVGVGDTIDISGSGIEPLRATVTGLAVLPALGPFGSDRSSPGDGMVLPAALLGPGAEGLATFVGLDVVDGTDRTALLGDLRGAYGTWGADAYTVDHAEPVRPAEIVDAEGLRSIPLFVGALLGVSVVVGLAFVVAASVRARRRELAILRVLGFTGRQVRGSVRVQAVATMSAALVIGVPAGIVLGRLAWRAFASNLAVVQSPSTKPWVIVVTVAIGLLAAVVAASVPAAMAARAHPVVLLRSE